MQPLDFDSLDATEFEEFCFELLRDLGFTDVDWRKGTGLSASPSDRGRDLVARFTRTDVDGSQHAETWFVDCKHHKRGVPPEKVQGLLAWAHAERPHTCLIIASNFLSNATKDYLHDYEQNNRPPFRVKYWERPILERLTEDKSELLARFLLTEGMRSESEVIAAQEEFFDKAWHERHLMFREAYESGDRDTPEAIYKTALEAAARVRERHGEENLGPYTDFEWGMVNGKLSALRWVLGDEWDFLDT
jgi:hypothetical protein